MTARRLATIVFGAAAALAIVPVPSYAELVTFTTGRTMSVAAHREDGDLLVFSLRGGGEMSVEAALVAAIGPDEVPYPEPAAAVAVESTPVPVETQTLRVDPTFDPIIRRVAEEQGVDASLVRAVIQVESGYQPRARSSKGAVGLMQLMPATARQYGVRNLYDPSANIRAGVSHLKSLLDRFPLVLALAAYNAGEAAVERFAGIPPYPETIDYVARIRALVGR